MGRYFSFGVILFLFSSCVVSKKSKVFPVVPFPEKVKTHKGFFVLSKEVRFRDEAHLFGNEISGFNNFLTTQFGFSLGVDAAVMLGGIPIILP